MNGTVFRDLTLLLVLGFVAMVVWMAPHLNPPAVSDGAEPPGNVIAALSWPEGDTDVDLWVMGPHEARPVGYSNKGGLLWNLLRDDLGNSPDATPLNYENAYTRGALSGEYIVNAHCYRCPVLPVPVTLEVSLKNGGALRKVAVAQATLERTGEELTVLRFRIKDGKLVPGSLNHLYTKLRSAVKAPHAEQGM